MEQSVISRDIGTLLRAITNKSVNRQQAMNIAKQIKLKLDGSDRRNDSQQESRSS